VFRLCAGPARRPARRSAPSRAPSGAHAGHRANYVAAPRRRSMGLGLDLHACRKGGTKFPIETSLRSIETTEGRAAMALVTDITERRSLELAARQHEKLAALATLSAGIAHELNNPIGIISTRVELMHQDAASAPLPGDVVEDLQLGRAPHRVSGRSASAPSRPRAGSRTRGPAPRGCPRSPCRRARRGRPSSGRCSLAGATRRPSVAP
jgi:signal transduction histidine kinase